MLTYVSAGQEQRQSDMLRDPYGPSRIGLIWPRCWKCVTSIFTGIDYLDKYLDRTDILSPKCMIVSAAMIFQRLSEVPPGLEWI